jgi:hypothetical protein
MRCMQDACARTGMRTSGLDFKTEHCDLL